jgi:hypothetical protein
MVKMMPAFLLVIFLFLIRPFPLAAGSPPSAANPPSSSFQPENSPEGVPDRMAGPRGDQREFPGESAGSNGESQPGYPFYQERTGEEPPGQTREGDSADVFQFRERDRQQLLAPPASVQPRRDGRDDSQWTRPRVGPRRLAPTPDLDGRGSPFDFGGPEDERMDRERNRLKR